MKTRFFHQPHFPKRVFMWLAMGGLVLLPGCQHPGRNPPSSAGFSLQTAALIQSDPVMRDFGIVVDVIRHNLANAHTPGYKRIRFQFQEAPNPASGTDFPQSNPAIWRRDQAARLNDLARDFSQGDLMWTGRQFDFAIQGEGFFKVQLPDGREAFTRAGSFHVIPHTEGRLMTSEGYPLQCGFPPVPDGAGVRITVSSHGAVNYATARGSTNFQMMLFRFQDPSGLMPIGESLFLESVQSGTPASGPPGKDGMGQLIQGCYEGSNVDVEKEKAMLTQIQRAAEAYAEAVEIEQSVKDGRLPPTGQPKVVR
jgi:flagellar basal-body rod protein FlgG